MVISGTRIIYPASSNEVMVHLENKGNHPLWFSHGWTTEMKKKIRRK
nr:fimbria/pilus periplasmic chaperone [Serratia marcescens]